MNGINSKLGSQKNSQKALHKKTRSGDSNKLLEEGGKKSQRLLKKFFNEDGTIASETDKQKQQDDYASKIDSKKEAAAAKTPQAGQTEDRPDCPVRKLSTKQELGSEAVTAEGLPIKATGATKHRRIASGPQKPPKKKPQADDKAHTPTGSRSPKHAIAARQAFKNLEQVISNYKSNIGTKEGLKVADQAQAAERPAAKKKKSIKFSQVRKDQLSKGEPDLQDEVEGELPVFSPRIDQHSGSKENDSSIIFADRELFTSSDFQRRLMNDQSGQNNASCIEDTLNLNKSDSSCLLVDSSGANLLKMISQD